MKSLIVLLLSTLALASAARNKRSIFGSWVDPPNSAQLAMNRGYPAEIHEVTTEDGYILKVFRIPYGRNDQPSNGRPPVIIQHGILCDSDCWTISTSQKGIGYILADAGYDVWIGNNRGTTYGLKHVNLTTSDKQFWNFSFDEMGYYDLPAMINYILKVNGASKVTYVGHSQGTTQFFAMASLRPEYNDKIQVFSALAPIAFLNGTEGAIRILSQLTTEFSMFMKFFHMYHILGHDFLTNIFTHFMCSQSSWFNSICDDVIEFLAGFDMPQLNQTLVEMAVQYAPAGASAKQIVHFGQLCQDGKFQRFDYGKSQNMKIYNSAAPPFYDLSKVTAPVMLHYAENDYLARPNNVFEIYRKLGSTNVKLFKVNNTEFNHVDFMWAKNVDTLLFNHVRDNIKLYL